MSKGIVPILLLHWVARPTLLLAGLLGIACTAIYALTGSLWGMALFHWVVVMVWLFGLGGKRRLVVKG